MSKKAEDFSNNFYLDKFKETNENKLSAESLSYGKNEDGEKILQTKTTKSRKIQRSLSSLRRPRQKFCLRWQKDFPWLRADRIQESIGFCVYCQKELVCKKSHLERHQKSFKHWRSKISADLKQESITDLEYINTTEILDEHYQDHGITTEKYQNGIEITPLHIELEDYQSNKVDKNVDINQRHLICTEYYTSESSGSFTESQSKQYSSTIENISSCSNSPRNNEKRIDQTEELVEQTEEQMKIMNNEICASKHKALTRYKNRNDDKCVTNCQNCKKDNFDLFFEYISMSVKSLPPKLATELKGQISQLIAEFELRAIREKEIKKLTKRLGE